MTRNLETADKLAKLILSCSVVLSYFAGIISGPFARAMMLLGLLVIFIFVAKTLLAIIMKN